MTDPEIGVEVDPADAAEQARSVVPEATGGYAKSQDPEAPEWDALQQSEVVELDDEYR